MAKVIVIFDRSLSMAMNGYFHEAQSHAMEIARVSSDTGGRDDLQGIVLMGPHAAVADRSALESAEWDYGYGTNLAEASVLAKQCMNGQAGRAVVVSDLFATAHTDAENNVVFGWPPYEDIVDATTRAIRSCARDSIVIEAWRFCHPAGPESDESSPIQEAILAAGGTIQDIPIEDDRPDIPPEMRNCG